MKYYYRLILTILMVSMSLSDLVSSQAQSAFSYGVVYSSDRDIQEAQYEIDQLPRRLRQYKNQKFLFKREQWYVSVVVFLTKSDAEAARPIIENEYRRGSFIVELQKWCRSDWSKSKVILLGIPYYECQSSKNR